MVKRASIVCGVLCWVILTAPFHGYAVDWEDLRDPQPLPSVPNPYYGQSYTPYPPIMAPGTQAPSVPRPWYKRLLNPLVKRTSPPIQQVPKTPNEPAKETAALPDPLIRLAKEIVYGETQVPPGFYLLSLQSGSDGNASVLRLRRQQQTVLSVPAHPMASAGPVATTSEASLPPPPEKAGVAASARADKTPQKATGLVTLSENGQTLVLLYQQGSQQYASEPLRIDTVWQPD